MNRSTVVHRRWSFASQWVAVLVFGVCLAASAKERPSDPLCVVTTGRLPFEFRSPRLLHHSSRVFADLVYYDTTAHAMMLSANDGHGRFSAGRSIYPCAVPTVISVGALNGDSIDDIVLVYRDQSRIVALVSSDSGYRAQSLHAGYYPEDVAIGDIDNDEIPDIMCFGRLSSGVTLLTGSANGAFRKPRELFPSVPVSAVSIVTLNRDNVADIALYNWLTNEMTLYFGTGRLRFSEQTVLSFGADSVQVLCDDFNGDGITDIAVSSAQYNTLQIYGGDGLGTVALQQTLTLSEMSQRLVSSSAGLSGLKNILSTNCDRHTFSLYLAQEDGQFYEEVVFGMDTAATSCLVGRLDADTRDDVVTMDPSSNSYAVFWNGPSDARRDGGDLHIAVGKRPSSVGVTDLNGDGRDDIFVANNASSTASILLSGVDGFSGQVSVETPEEPSSVGLFAKSDTSMTFFSVHRKNPRIGIITVVNPGRHTANLAGDLDIFSLTLPEPPITVLPDFSMFQRGISLYAFMPSATNAIVFYQQLNGVQFVTKSLVPVIPTRIIYSTINDLNDDGQADLLYIFSDPEYRKEYLGVTYNDSSGNYKGSVFTQELPDTATKKAFVYVEDIDGDHRKDCLVYVAPQSALVLYRGTREGDFAYASVVGSHISISSFEQLQLFDENGDGIVDLLYPDASSSVLMVLHGRGNGRFADPMPVIPLPPGAAYRCGDFNGDNVADVVYTDPNGYSVTVHYGSTDTH